MLRETGSVEPRHILRKDLNRRLLGFATSSWNGYEAVYQLQRLTALLPVFTEDLVSMFGKNGVGDARRIWGMVADLTSAMLNEPVGIDGLVELGFTDVTKIDHIVPYQGEFALAGHPILGRLDLRVARNGDLAPVLRLALAHDELAKPLLTKFQDELLAYDTEAEYIINEDEESDIDVQNFRQLLRLLPDEPTAFPEWDGRPLFLEEQRSFLDYMVKSVATEIIAHNLIDDQLGRVLLYRAGAIYNSSLTDELVLNPKMIPAKILRRPVELVCHQAGHAVLSALHAFDPEADVLERLFVVEMAIWNELNIDITEALATTRQLAMERHLRELDDLIVDVLRTEEVIDLREPKVTLYEFPDFNADQRPQ
jgi:hypothetical protein